MALDYLFGDEALLRFVLLDLKLAKVDGAGVLRRIRADGRMEGLVVDDDTFLRAIRRLEVSLTGFGTFAGRPTGRAPSSAPAKRGWADDGGR